MENKANKPVALVIGGSRGIGRQVAVDLANRKYFVVVAAKTTSNASHAAIPPSRFPPDPNSSQSTINTVTREINEAGGSAIALQVDVRDVEEIKKVVDETVQRLGHLDVLVYNSGAIWWSAVETTPVKRFQLMQKINPEGLYAAVMAALPHFGRQDWKGRIIVVSPPIYSRFFRGKTAYAVGKVGMSVLTKGLAMDFVRQGRSLMAISSIWPGVAIESAATQSSTRSDGEKKRDLRKATVFSDAIIALINAPANKVNGLLVIDEDFLREQNPEHDFEQYNLVPGSQPRRIMPKQFPDLSVEEQDDEGVRIDSAKTQPQSSTKTDIQETRKAGSKL